MIPLVLVLAACAAQAEDTVPRRHPNRSAYQEAVDACRDAEKLAPEAALDKLAPIFADGIEKGRFALVEQRITIEAKSQEFNPHDFYPYHLRGRARLQVARKFKDEEARRYLLDAAGDLQASLTRTKAHLHNLLPEGQGELRASLTRVSGRSAELLTETQRELWENVRAALTYDGWKPGQAALADKSLTLLAGTELSKDAVEWTAGEIGRVDARLRALRKEPGDPDSRRPEARRAAEWCDTVTAALRGIPAFQSALGDAGKAGSLAVSIRDSRGTFRLKIGVSPWATVRRLERGGEEIPLTDRDTPLLIPQELEIDDYSLELVHPNGRKNAHISANSLQPGRTYVLWGDMNGDKFEVSELPK
ncbi:MAG TPA: hypothetical protein VE981_10000 [Planctomycetota bacterium]|nr:hypothetical protein [Planctomycetota bacterium]